MGNIYLQRGSGTVSQNCCDHSRGPKCPTHSRKPGDNGIKQFYMPLTVFQ